MGVFAFPKVLAPRRQSTGATCVPRCALHVAMLSLTTMSLSKSMKEGLPRKVPTGKRGQEIVQAIRQATQRLLASGDLLEDISTNQIAERAGVSVGSFYQYYPNKRAVIADLFRDLEVQTLKLAQERLSIVQADDVESLVTILVEVLLDISLGDGAARREIRLNVPPIWALDTSAEVDRSVFQFVADFLARNQNQLRPGVDPRRATFILLRGAEAIVEAMFMETPEFLDRESLGHELRELCLRYLGHSSRD